MNTSVLRKPLMLGMLRLLLFILLVSPLLALRADQGIPDIRIGVLAFRGHQQTMTRWQPMADYLNQYIPDANFQIIPLNLQQVRKATAAGEIDFVLTNPGNYVLLEQEHGVSRITTLKRHWKGHEYSHFGAVIFSRRDNSDINEIIDVKGHSLMVVNDHAFGGFQMAWREFKDAGVDPFKDLSEIMFNGFPQDNIVHSVLSGKADVGTVRTGLLENMALNGKIELDKIRVLGRRNVEGFQFQLSTRLYPEWPLAKLKHTPDALASLLVVALLSAPESAFFISDSDWMSWTIPLDYSDVHELMMDLQIGPYQPRRSHSISELVKLYAHWVLVALAVLLGLAMITIYVLQVNRRLVYTQQVLRDQITERIGIQEKLNEHQSFLEQRVEERTESLAKLNSSLKHSEETLRELNRVVTVFPAPLDEKIRGLIELGRKHFGFAAASIYSKNDAGISLIMRVGQAPRDAAAVLPTGISEDEFDQMMLNDEIMLEERSFVLDGKTEGNADLKSCIAVKVIVEGKPFGFLCLADDKEVSRSLGEVDRDILQLIADWLGMEFARKQASDREQQHLSDLAHVTRLSTMGEMASGLAHELNQPLTAIANYLRGCLRRIDRGNLEPSELEAIMLQTVNESERAAEIIRRMRAFVNKEDPHHESVEINELVIRVSGFLRSEMERESIELNLRLADGLPLLMVDAIQIEQVLLNLIRNAIDAVRAPWQGSREIEIISRLNGDDMIHVEVMDSGCGLPEGEEEQIFDPFFTTKDEGMGMGLSISRTIIEAHGGAMYTDTTGKKTIFGIALPQSVREN
jgi:C4-dicarboxylate-specific signal transduction histidine kinase